MQKKELYLVLTKEWFTEILEGRKTEEYRNFTDFYVKRLCEVNEDNQITGFKKYDVVRFQMGYRKNAPQMVVKIKGMRIDGEQNEEGLLIPDETIFTIELGEILEKKNC